MKSKNALLPPALVLLSASLACGLFSIPVAKELQLPATSTWTPRTSPAPTSQPATDTPRVEPDQVEESSTQAQPAGAPHYAPGDPVVLDEIHMLSTTEGWALSGPFVLVTGDDGETWRQASPPAALPEGTWKAGSGENTLETSDGGETWEPASEPGYGYSGDQVSVHGAFLDARNAWVVYSTGTYFDPETRVWRTSDGGRTWTPSQGFAPQVRGDTTWAEIFALDSEHLWLRACSAWVGAGQHYDCQFFRSSNGGLRWEALEVDVGVDYTGMAFTNPSNGWLIWQTLSAYYYIPPEYATTIDGGLTWESRDFPPPPEAPDIFMEGYLYCEPYQLNLLGSRSVRLLIGCFEYGYPPEAFASYLYATDDGGETWSTLRLPDPVHAPEYTLIYFDSDRALLLGREMYASTDGGETWKQFKTVYWDGEFSFVDRQNGWAVAREEDEVALVRTVDGGTTWEELRPTIGE
jgi:photosystem II stability/assembly factor-like uncharacterized protein